MAGKTRAPHKEGCMCVVCKQKRAKTAAPVSIAPAVRITPAPPSEVRLDSLPPAAKFELGGRKHSVMQKVEGMVVCYDLFANDTVTLGGLTKVKPL